MLALDALWWAIGMRIVRNAPLRLVIILFMAVQVAAVLNELLGWLGIKIVDPVHIPTALLVTICMWHYFGLTVLTGFAVLFAGAKLVRRRREKKMAAQKLAIPAPADPITRRAFLGACAVLAPPFFTFGLTGIALGQICRFRVRRFTLSIPSLPRDLDGLTIVNVSDIHVGQWTHGQVLRDIVNTTNSLRGDLVVLTGDLINFELADLPEALSLVKAMPGRYGTWMVEGNHDLLENPLVFERTVKASGIPLLLDESEVATIRGYPVQLFGLRWMDLIGSRLDQVTKLQLRAVLARRQPDAFPILLAHHPHTFDAAVAAGLPLTLTGHTHGGQLMLDKHMGVGPILFRYWSGLYQRGNSRLIVSNGVGNTFPLRINAPAEIVHLTLRCA